MNLTDIVNEYLVQNRKPQNEGFKIRGKRITSWRVDGVPKPTESDIQKLKRDVFIPMENSRVRENRRKELSKLDGEGFDAIRKEIDAIRAGEPQTSEYQEYRRKVEVIKENNPKRGDLE